MSSVAGPVREVSVRAPDVVFELSHPAVAQLPVVVDQRPTDKLLATMNRDVGKAVGADDSVTHAITAAGVLGTLALLPSVMMVAVGALMGDSMATHAGMVGTAYSGALVASTAPMWRMRQVLVNRKLATKLRAEAQQLEQAFGAATGLERAFIAARAHAIYVAAGGTLQAGGGIADRLIDLAFPSFSAFSFMKRLRPLAAAFAELPADERERLATVVSLCATVEGDAQYFEGDLETKMVLLAGLTQEERNLVRAVILTPVLAELDKDPGNKWRRARFLDALDGKRTPYSSDGLEIGAPDVTLESLRLDWAEKTKGTCATAEQAVAAITRGLTKGRFALASVTDEKAALRTAAYFETRGLAATLYKRGDLTRLAVYDPAASGEACYVKGSYTS